MKTFFELCDGKPSNAVKAMISGLKNQSKRKDFRIDMADFGGYEEGVCFGCAATCSVQELSGKNFLPNSYSIRGTVNRAAFLNMHFDDLTKFEYSIDSLRNGVLYSLLDYFRVPLDLTVQLNSEFGYLWKMNTYNWEKEIPKIQPFLDRLIELGL